MPLLMASVGDEVSVVDVGGAPAVRQHLNDMGFTVGSSVCVVQKISTGLIVRVKETSIAIDKSMAAKIMVR